MTLRLKRWARRLLLMLIAVFVIGVVAIGALVFAVLIYPQLGRITDFSEIAATTPLEGTNYTLEAAEGDDKYTTITLRNNATDEGIVLLSNYPSSVSPALYKLLEHHGSIYLIARVWGDGNNGAYWFDVYNLSTSEPHYLNGDYMDLFIGASCVYPRLEGDDLVFEIAHDCDLYPLFAQEQRSKTITLQ